jgi:hypothetical protein
MTHVSAMTRQCVEIFSSSVMSRVCLHVFSVLGATSSAYASDLQLHLGGLHATHSELTYSWALEYRHPLNKHLSASLSWLTEGHVPGHHRDGQAVQLWWHTASAARRPVFELGLGPYRYFDTRNAQNADGYTDAHGWGFVATAGATWEFSGKWLASLRINRTQVHESIKTTALVAGVGYRFGPANGSTSDASSSSAISRAIRTEVDVMVGGTTVNSFDSDARLAKAVSVRFRATDHLTGSLTYIDEGKVQPGWRAGIAPQVWLEQDLTDHLSVGAGIGPYFATRNPRKLDGEDAPSTSALVSITAAYAIAPAWNARLTWNRVATRYDRDADVVMVGLGYRF